MLHRMGDDVIDHIFAQECDKYADRQTEKGNPPFCIKADRCNEGEWCNGDDNRKVWKKN